MVETKQVTVLADNRSGRGQGILRGVSRYALSHSYWDPFFADARGMGPDSRSADWQDDGIIAPIVDHAYLAVVRRLGVPVVNISSNCPDMTIPSVLHDGNMCGRLAAEHLLGVGLRIFGFCGRRGDADCSSRQKGFTTSLKENGLDCSIFDTPAPTEADKWWPWLGSVGNWLKSLPKPVGVMACDDMLAWHVLDICRRIGIVVPEDVAVVGVDNDGFFCDMSMPTLTSVDIAPEAIGYRAAQLLDDLMAGEEPPNTPILIPPIGIIPRRSSDILTTDDSQLEKALQFIHQQINRPITVEDILDHLTISRRSLERRFLKHLGRTPLAEIRRVRISHAKRLLGETDMMIAEVAEKSGYRNVQHLYQVFRKECDCPPAAYRRQFRAR